MRCVITDQAINSSIRYRLPGDDKLSNQLTNINIYDIKGKRVRNLVNRFQRPGEHSVTWDGKNDAGTPLASGIYLVSLGYGSNNLIHKLVLIK